MNHFLVLFLEIEEYLKKKREKQTMEEIKMLNQESIRTLRQEEYYKYLGISIVDTIK